MNKLNKKGQSLILFIIFLPILLMAFALIIDVGMMYHAKIKGESLLKSAKKDNVDIKDYFKINNIEILNLENTNENNNKCTTINYKIDSIFGNLIGYKEYEIKITDC